MTKIQNLKLSPRRRIGSSNVLVIEYCNLEFICYLVLVIWCFQTWFLGLRFHKTNLL